MNDYKQPLRVGVGGPVGSGKTALLELLCKAMRDDYSLAVVTNDIFTREDTEFLVRHNALDADRIRAVETGGCPHTAIREDVTPNLLALEDLTAALQKIVAEAGVKVTGVNDEAPVDAPAAAPAEVTSPWWLAVLLVCP